MTDREQPTLAQVAYDAYSAMLRGFPPTAGASWRPWDALAPAEHAAWTAMVMQIEAYVADLYARRTHT